MKKKTKEKLTKILSIFIALIMIASIAIPIILSVIG
jgi:hypothetical protein